jgi:hypothetical protein
MHPNHASAVLFFAAIAVATRAEAAPGDLLIATGHAIYDFTGGGYLPAAAAFATNASEELSALCVGPGAHLYAGTSGGKVLDVTAGGEVGSAAPFATLPGTVHASRATTRTSTRW